MKIKLTPKEERVHMWCYDRIREAHNGVLVDFKENDNIISYITYEIKGEINENLIAEYGLKYEIVDD